MIVWEITTKKIKGFKDKATWLVTEPYKTPSDAIIHFLGEHYGRYKEKHIIKIERIKL